jgi:hypothetical protein
MSVVAMPQILPLTVSASDFGQYMRRIAMKGNCQPVRLSVSAWRVVLDVGHEPAIWVASGSETSPFAGLSGQLQPVAKLVHDGDCRRAIPETHITPRAPEDPSSFKKHHGVSLDRLHKARDRMSPLEPINGHA